MTETISEIAKETIKEILSLDKNFDVTDSLKLGSDLNFESIDFLDLFVELENRTNKKLSPKECFEFLNASREAENIKDITVLELIRYVEKS